MAETRYQIVTLDDYRGILAGMPKLRRPIKLIQNHHTYIPGYAHFKGDNHSALMLSMRRSHIERGFTDIAQNLTTFPDGKIGINRPLDTAPAGIKGANAYGVCIEHVGNFDAGGDTMTPEHRLTIVGLNAMLCDRFAIEPSTTTVVYHHWFDLKTGKRTGGTGATKTCPGTAFFGGNTVQAAQAGFIPLVAAAVAGAFARRSAVVRVDGLRVRMAPNAAAAVVGTLNKGDRVEVGVIVDGWMSIPGPLRRWVAVSYLDMP